MSARENRFDIMTITGLAFFLIGIIYFIILTSGFNIDKQTAIDFMFANIFTIAISFIFMVFGIFMILRRKR